MAERSQLENIERTDRSMKTWLCENRLPMTEVKSAEKINEINSILLQKFQSGSFSLQNRLGGKPKTFGKNDALKTLIEMNPTVSVLLPSLVYADKPQTPDHLEDNIRRVIADIRLQMLEKVIENWTSRLDYIRASRGSPMPEIIFKM
ncbi:hypothetical protein TNCV_1065981 [Trichonephila clavipes]|nr:hypothetical protein TNCV_1065981 [Trichonephila clavipes]